MSKASRELVSNFEKSVDVYWENKEDWSNGEVDCYEDLREEIIKKLDDVDALRAKLDKAVEALGATYLLLEEHPLARAHATRMQEIARLLKELESQK